MTDDAGTVTVFRGRPRPVAAAYGDAAMDEPCPTCRADAGGYCTVDGRVRRIPCVSRLRAPALAPLAAADPVCECGRAAADPSLSGRWRVRRVHPGRRPRRNHPMTTVLICLRPNSHAAMRYLDPDDDLECTARSCAGEHMLAGLDAGGHWHVHKLTKGPTDG